MIKSKNIFFININQKNLIIKTKNKCLFNINILTKKKRVRLRFKNKSKKKTYLITTSPLFDNFYISYNKTIQFNKNNFTYDLKKLKFLLKNKIKWNFKKFRYQGKGYKIKKFNVLSKITFRFGKSHWTKLLFNKKTLQIKRTKKNAYCCVSIKNKTFLDFKQIIKKIKGINKYTKRGVRLTRQLVKKRFGKVSQASSVYK